MDTDEQDAGMDAGTEASGWQLLVRNTFMPTTFYLRATKDGHTYIWHWNWLTRDDIRRDVMDATRRRELTLHDAAVVTKRMTDLEIEAVMNGDVDD